jgi:hypothetical protein
MRSTPTHLGVQLLEQLSTFGAILLVFYPFRRLHCAHFKMLACNTGYHRLQLLTFFSSSAINILMFTSCCFGFLSFEGMDSYNPSYWALLYFDGSDRLEFFSYGIQGGLHTL